MKNNRNSLDIIAKLAVIISVLIYTACATGSNMTRKLSLDQTIQKAAENLGANLEANIKIAMINYTSTSNALSEYVLDELGGALVNIRKVSVIDRRELDIIRLEENFQLSGEVSDESMVSIGKKLGAQMIVTGSLRDLGSEYRFTARILNVETARVEAFFSSDIFKNDRRTTYLLSVRNPPPPQITMPTAENPYKPLRRLQNATVIGTVQANFEDYSSLNNDRYITKHNEMAYNVLLETAKRDYSGAIDIVDITWVWTGYKGSSLCIYSASGKVVNLR
jgi:TolB-like protein